MKALNKKNIFSIVSIMIFILGISINSYAQDCEIEKQMIHNPGNKFGGYTTEITSVVDNGSDYTIILTVRHNGCSFSNCKELSHYSIEADKDTYSNVSVDVVFGDFEYDEIDMGWNLGGDPFKGFKIDDTEGIGDGDAGEFTITYTLTELQDQQTLAKAGSRRFIASFTEEEFIEVMECLSPTNNPPVANNDNNQTEVNTPVSGDMSTNDSDPDGDDLVYTTTPVEDPEHGSVVINGDGTYTYTPNNDYAGTDQFKYEVCDDAAASQCDDAYVYITIIEGPTANDDSETTDVNTPVTILVLDNDTEGSASLDPTSVTLDETTAPDPTTEGTFTVNPITGVVTFTPVMNYTGTVAIDYEVCDENSLCDNATITVVVEGTFTGPTAVDDSESTNINTPVEIEVLDNDIEGDGTLDPTSVDLDETTAPNPTTEGTFTVNATTGIVTFTPVTDYTGTVTINYEVCDDNSLCDVATITVTVVGGGSDSDGDGVPNDEDDYPTDPNRAFDNYYPADSPGTLAYEDLWPGRGDYDFNDLVLDYRFKTVTNASNKIVETVATFEIKAFGATFENGFGFQLPNNNIDAEDITVTGYDLQEDLVTLESNGLEANQTKPTIIVYDNTFNLMPHPGNGIGVNTDITGTYVEPVTVTINIAYEEDTYSLSQLDIASFNPFLIVDQNRGVEVHLPDYTPTDLVDNSYFGTSHDDSNPETGRYYKIDRNLPWAINIYESFDYPIEKREVSAAYIHFIEWAESSGESYADWYLNEDGYRNNSNIYSAQ